MKYLDFQGMPASLWGAQPPSKSLRYRVPANPLQSSLSIIFVPDHFLSQ